MAAALQLGAITEAYAPRPSGSPLARRLLTLRLLGWEPADVASRVIVAGLLLLLAIRIAANTIQTGHVTGLLLVASEGLVVVLMIIRRPTNDVDRRWITRTITAISIAGPPLVRPVTDASQALWQPASTGVGSDLCTAIASGLGLAMVVAAKVTLGRSFGLVPANRGLVSSGPYRLVRHPIYLGYLVTHVAFLVANPLAWNFWILGAADTALVIRSLYEERTLEHDPGYLTYEQRVPWRLVPGVF